MGTAVAGDEEDYLSDFALSSAFGDTFSGDIQPGVKAIGGMWFGFKRIALPDLQKLTIPFTGPVDNSYKSLGLDYNFVLDLSNRQFEPVPTELK